MAIGIFGGTFNPIHTGHLIMAQEVSVVKNLQKIIFIPAQMPPLKKNFLPAQHRYNMVQLAIDRNPLFSVMDIELQREGKSYTYDTLKELKGEFKEELIFIAGSDKLLEFPKWHRWKELFHEFEFAIVSRNSYPLEDIKKIKDRIPHSIYEKLQKNLISLPFISISSTQIRKKLKNNHPIKYFVPEEVENYIKIHKLYQDD